MHVGDTLIDLPLISRCYFFSFSFFFFFLLNLEKLFAPREPVDLTEISLGAERNSENNVK